MAAFTRDNHGVKMAYQTGGNMEGTKVLLTWAYDGSGVALRIPCVVVHAEAHGEAVVVVETADHEIFSALSRTYPSGWRHQYGKYAAYIAVPLAELAPMGTPPPLEPWNWND